MSERLPFVVVILTVAINALGIGLILPVMPSLLLEMGAPSLSEAAAIGGMLSLVFAAMQFLFGPLLGRLSDRFGRRAVLITSLIAVGIDYAILAVAGSLWLFCLARMLSGVASATFSVANAVLADMSPSDSRAKAFGLTGAAFGIGFGFSSNRPLVEKTPLGLRVERAYRNQIEASAYIVPVLAAAAFVGLESEAVRITCAVIVFGRAAFSPLYDTGIPFIRILGFSAASLGTLYLAYLLLSAFGD